MLMRWTEYLLRSQCYVFEPSLHWHLKLVLLAFRTCDRVLPSAPAPHAWHGTWYIPYVMTDTISLTACALFVVCSVDAFSRILSALWSSTTTPRAHAELHTSTVFLNDIDGLQHPDSFTFIPNTFFKQLRTETSRKTGIDEQSSRLAREFQRTFLYT